MKYVIKKIKCNLSQACISNTDARNEVEAAEIYSNKYDLSVGTGFLVSEDKIFGAKSWCFLIESSEPLKVKEVSEDDIQDQTQRFLKEDKERANVSNDIKQKENEAFNNLIATTAPSLEGYSIVETIDIVSAECVLGTNIFSDIAMSFSDVFGGRSDSAQNKLREAKKTCIMELKKEAFSIGANAIIAVDLDYSEISGGGKSMLFIVANGTAVKVVKNEHLLEGDAQCVD